VYHGLKHRADTLEYLHALSFAQSLLLHPAMSLKGWLVLARGFSILPCGSPYAGSSAHNYRPTPRPSIEA